MNELTVLKNIRPSYDRGLILTRLGYDKHKTDLPEKVLSEFDRLLAKAENTLAIAAAYRVIAIDRIDPPQVLLEDGTMLSGSALSKLLEGCGQALLMLATGGHRIMELIASLQEEGRMSEAVIIDAAASEITDSALDVVMSHVAQKLRSRGQVLTKMRFSPGYGDFDIVQQREFFRLLKAEAFGISLNEACLLVPEKTVFAIAGIAGSL